MQLLKFNGQHPRQMFKGSACYTFSSSTYTNQNARLRTPPCCLPLDPSPLLQIVFIDDRGRLWRDLSTLQEEAFDVFPDEVGFEIGEIVHLLEA